MAKALNDLGLLEKFFTSSYVTSKTLQDLINKTGNKFWSRRFLNGLSGSRVVSNWRFEIPEIVYSKLYGQNEKTANAVYQRDVRFDRYLASRMDRVNGDIFWGFQGSCLGSLKAARKYNKLALCEMTTGHGPAAKRILGEEMKLHPEWADSIDNVSFPEYYYERLCNEPHTADFAIGASEFTLQTLREDDVPESKLLKLPLGFELDHIPFEKHTNREGPVRLLYTGRITQRKGIKYLLEAMQGVDVKDAELHLIGFVHGSGDALRKFDRYRLHSPLQQYDLFRKYKEFDALVLPSVFEGFGLVIIEAMAAGLPVITTPNTIGPEAIRNGENGFLVPIRSAQGIYEAIQTLIKSNKEKRQLMRIKARESALRFSWDSYANRLHSFLKSIGHG